MPQSLARLYIHLVFSTKLRSRTLTDDIRDPLHRYIATVINNQKCHSVLANSREDHIHILFDLHRTVALSNLVQEIKTASSKWIKTQGLRYHDFAWQSGYAAFAVDAFSMRAARAYVANQQEHHRVETFQDEYRRLLLDNGIEFDEQYIWD